MTTLDRKIILNNLNQIKMKVQKVIISALVILSLGTIGYLFWQNQLMAKQIASYKMVTSCSSCYSPNCEISPQFDLPAAMELVSNYRNNHWMKINGNCAPFNIATMAGKKDADTIIDSRSAWFDLGTLKKFIHTIEVSSCCDTCPNLVLGIRIYYAEYPQDTAELRVRYNVNNPSYAGLHTLLMIPTFRDEISRDVDFNPGQIIRTGCSVLSTFETTTTGPVFSMLPSTTAKNHGGLAPPPYFCNLYWNNTGALFMKYVDANGYNSSGTLNCPPTGN